MSRVLVVGNLGHEGRVAKMGVELAVQFHAPCAGAVSGAIDRGLLELGSVAEEVGASIPPPCACDHRFVAGPRCY